MATKISNFAHIISFALLLLSFRCSASTPRKLALVQQPLTVLKYHNGPLLKGDYTINLLYYGRFSPSQRAIIADFVRSLSSSSSPPSVSAWWATTSSYRAGPTHLTLGTQILDDKYSLGKSLKISQITSLTNKLNPAAGPASITAVLTSADVAVEGFCSSRRERRGRDFINYTRSEMASVPGDLIWEIVKKNNAFLVKQFGNSTAKVQFSKERNNLYNVNSFKHSGLANKKTVSIQPAGEGLSVVLATTKTKKQRKPASIYHKSVMKKEFRRMAKAVTNQVTDNYYRPDLTKAALARLSTVHRSLRVAKSGAKKRNRQAVRK